MSGVGTAFVSFYHFYGADHVFPRILFVQLLHQSTEAIQNNDQTVLADSLRNLKSFSSFGIW
jgi:hypothetical protein